MKMKPRIPAIPAGRNIMKNVVTILAAWLASCLISVSLLIVYITTIYPLTA